MYSFFFFKTMLLVLSRPQYNINHNYVPWETKKICMTHFIGDSNFVVVWKQTHSVS